MKSCPLQVVVAVASILAGTGSFCDVEGECAVGPGEAVVLGEIEVIALDG